LHKILAELIEWDLRGELSGVVAADQSFCWSWHASNSLSKMILTGGLLAAQ